MAKEPTSDPQPAFPAVYSQGFARVEIVTHPSIAEWAETPISGTSTDEAPAQNEATNEPALSTAEE